MNHFFLKITFKSENRSKIDKITPKNEKTSIQSVSKLFFSNGGANGARTRHLIHAMDALSQMSYCPKQNK